MEYLDLETSDINIFFLLHWIWVGICHNKSRSNVDDDRDRRENVTECRPGGLQGGPGPGPGPQCNLPHSLDGCHTGLSIQYLYFYINLQSRYLPLFGFLGWMTSLTASSNTLCTPSLSVMALTSMYLSALAALAIRKPCCVVTGTGLAPETGVSRNFLSCLRSNLQPTSSLGACWPWWVSSGIQASRTLSRLLGDTSEKQRMNTSVPG